MAKYLDSNGLAHLVGKIKATFSTKQHTHTIPTKSAKGVDTFSQGTLPTLGTAISITPVTSKTVVTGVTKKTVVTGGTTTEITPVASKTVVTGGSKTSIPNISVSNKNIPNVTNAGTAMSAVCTQGTLTITANTPATLGTAISVGSASAGTAIQAYTSLTTGDSVTEGDPVDVYTGLTTGDSVTVSTGASVNTGTAVSIPNVTGVGTLPSLTTESITVLNGNSTSAAEEPL